MRGCVALPVGLVAPRATLRHRERRIVMRRWPPLQLGRQNTGPKTGASEVPTFALCAACALCFCLRLVAQRRSLALALASALALGLGLQQT